MKRILMLSVLVPSVSGLLVACSLSQDLGGGTGATTPTSTPSSTGTTPPMPPQLDGGSSGANDSGTSSGDSGLDAAVTRAECPAVAGYPAGPYMTYTLTAGSFAGVHDTVVPPNVTFPNGGGPSVLAGLFNNPPAQSDYAGHFLVKARRSSYVQNGHFVGPEWTFDILTESLTMPATGQSESVIIRPGMTGALGLNDGPPGPQTPQDDKLGRYPSGGPGTCTITYDYVRLGDATKKSCINAHFSCTGLVGKATSETFDLVDGKFASSN